MNAFRLVCAGCGTPAPPMLEDPYPFRCRCALEVPDTDHVVGKVLAGDLPPWPVGSTEPNPLIRYRGLFYSHDVFGGAGADPDGSFLEIARGLTEDVFRVCGQRFSVTPFRREAALSTIIGFTEPGGVWIKDETENVSGSHKARHLAGIMLYLLRLAPARRPDLAIASCGNAALAAAVVARAADWPLHVFVPVDANPVVVEQLRELGTTIVICARQPGQSGDPCYHRFRTAVAAGTLPFCCQGPDNGLTIEGGETIAYEIVDQVGEATLDAAVIQVGGGALASACVQGFERSVALGRLRAMPRIYTVQTEGAAPLARAFVRVADRARQRGTAEALAHAASHRSEYMWPWEEEPRSVAHGILDDETYDWLAVVKGMLETGGTSVVVDEAALKAANQQGRQATGIDVDHTGSAGLAGLVALRAKGAIAPDENAAVIFSGVRRTSK